MMRLVALCIAVCACNQIFDLQSTTAPPESDTDADGVVDVVDNCPLTPNPTQTDTDFDSLGDACDPCPFGPQSGLDDDKDGVDDACDVCLTGANTDEDSDFFLDGCDVCPGMTDDQADADGDGVGDACDTSSAPHHRVFFDGFDPPRPGWNSGFQQWHKTAGGYAPDLPLAGNPLYGPWNRGAAVSGFEVHVDAVVMLPPPNDQFDFVGVNLILVNNGQALAGCTIFATPQLTWSTFGTTPVTVDPGLVAFHLFVQQVPNLPGKVQFGCTVGGHTEVAGIFYDVNTWVPTLITTVGTEFLSIDVVD